VLTAFWTVNSIRISKKGNSYRPFSITKAPPNAKCHRQLVLIGKTIQNVANMASQTKESFMEEMNDFRTKNVPKMKHFYDNIMVRLENYN
jgi:hypothetical protein